jgi:hypothetical protein
MRKLAAFLNERPLSFLGILLSIRAALYGLSFISHDLDIVKTVLYQEVSNIMSPTPFGIALLLVGIVTAIGFYKNYSRVVNYGCFAESCVWLFASIVYVMAGSWMLALISAFPFAVMTGYLGYIYGNRSRWLITD